MNFKASCKWTGNRQQQTTYFSSVGLRPGMPEALLDDWKHDWKSNFLVNANEVLHYLDFFDNTDICTVDTDFQTHLLSPLSLNVVIPVQSIAKAKKLAFHSVVGNLPGKYCNLMFPLFHTNVKISNTQYKVIRLTFNIFWQNRRINNGLNSLHFSAISL